MRPHALCSLRTSARHFPCEGEWLAVERKFEQCSCEREEQLHLGILEHILELNLMPFYSDQNFPYCLCYWTMVYAGSGTEATLHSTEGKESRAWMAARAPSG